MIWGIYSEANHHTGIGNLLLSVASSRPDKGDTRFTHVACWFTYQPLKLRSLPRDKLCHYKVDSSFSSRGKVRTVLLAVALACTALGLIR